MNARSFFLVLCCSCLPLQAAAPAAYVRVNQIGYEADHGPFRAYLMSTADASKWSFRVLDGMGHALQTGLVGKFLGTWSNSAQLQYKVYALDFTVPCGRYSISAAGEGALALSPRFAVDRPEVLYPGLLLNTKFFYETQRDGPDYVPNALRSAPAHLNDKAAHVFETPLLDDNDEIATKGVPLSPVGKIINAEGGWWDAGDYMKYVETISYTVALQEIGIRDFPAAMGPLAPLFPPKPPLAISYAGGAMGAPARADFTSEADFGIRFLMRMWDDSNRTLYYQVGNSQDWDNFSYLSDYDIWRLPQDDDTWDGCDHDARFICHRPVFVAGPAGSKISPNLAGRLAADFAVCYQLKHNSDPTLANQCLQNAEHIFALADTSLPDPAKGVGSGTCSKDCLLTIIPFDGYPETVWDDDMELGATELYLASVVAARDGSLPARNAAASYLQAATRYARDYVQHVYRTGGSDTLNLYDVSGLAHYELYRALNTTASVAGLALTATQVRMQFLQQVDNAVATARTDTWGFGTSWSSDTASKGAGISVMASEAYAVTGRDEYDRYAQRWMANILGANAWGSSFIVGDGSATFPNCIQHQVANLAGSLDGTSGGVPILWGAVSEGPSGAATSGLLDGMLTCPADGVDRFAKFNGNSGSFDANLTSVYQDNVQSYSTTEPGIDLTATSFLMWSWRLTHGR